MHDLERDDAGVDQDFAGIFEIHRDPAVDDGLDLPDAPIRLLRVADEISRLDEGVKRWHSDETPPDR